jgi:hypothetical protein
MCSKVKMAEMFDRWISQQPPTSPGAAPAPERDPLQEMPDFNVYRAEATQAEAANHTPRQDSPRGRRNSIESGVSAATGASAKRNTLIQEAVAGNGSRRAFTSPDGKVQLKLTSFRAPSGVDVAKPYIAKVVNPRSKSPAAVLTAAQKKKQEDDYVRAIVAANRKAVEERVAAERTRRRSSSGGRLTSAASASAVKTAGAAGQGARKGSPTRGMHIAPAEPEKRPSISPNRYRPIAELDLFRVEPHSPTRDLPKISFHSFVKVRRHLLQLLPDGWSDVLCGCNCSCVQILWEMAASYMDIPLSHTAVSGTDGGAEDGEERERAEAEEREGDADGLRRWDSLALRSLRAFVHLMSRSVVVRGCHRSAATNGSVGVMRCVRRYKARMVTKEVEKVLPLLAHDEDLRHKALRVY